MEVSCNFYVKSVNRRENVSETRLSLNKQNLNAFKDPFLCSHRKELSYKQFLLNDLLNHNKNTKKRVEVSKYHCFIHCQCKQLFILIKPVKYFKKSFLNSRKHFNNTFNDHLPTRYRKQVDFN